MTIYDTPVLQGRRLQLVKTIASKGIEDKSVLDAIQTIPRHLFLSKGLEYLAYDDRAISISDNQTISQPYTVAFQTQLLEVRNGDKILEIGTGSGYQAAVLSVIGADVYSVERIENLYNNSTKLLKKLGYKVKIFYGDGYEGVPQYQPFDGILITAAIEIIPDILLNQLKIGGCLVAPVGKAGYGQVMKKITRKSEFDFDTKEYGLFTFVPMLKGKI